MPCMVKASLQHHVQMLQSAIGLSSGGADWRSAGTGTTATGTTGTTGASGAAEESGKSAHASALNGPPAASRASSKSSSDQIREGLERSIRGGGEIGEPLRDSRLMVQIGMLLGFAYLGFLAVWFWATRGRAALKD